MLFVACQAPLETYTVTFLDKDGEELIPCEFKELYNWFGHISYFRDININCDKYGNGVWMPTMYLRSINLRTKS